MPPRCLPAAQPGSVACASRPPSGSVACHPRWAHRAVRFLQLVIHCVDRARAGLLGLIRRAASGLQRFQMAGSNQLSWASVSSPSPHWFEGQSWA